MSTHAGTVTLGVEYATDSTQWTTITPRYEDVFSSNANNSNIVYVSTSGIDAPGNGTLNNPVKTLTYAFDTTKAIGTLGTGIRDGYPDWVLLKKGDTFPAEAGTRTIFVSGASSTEPAVIGSYSTTGVTTTTPQGTGTGARPILIDTKFFTNAHGDNLAIIGLDFYNRDRDPNDVNCTFPISVGPNAIELTYIYTWVLIEDCKFRFFGIAVVSQTVSSAYVYQSGLILRKNVFSKCYGANLGDHSGGALLCLDNLRAEENVFDHNGWNETLTASQTATFTNASPTVMTLPAGVTTQGIASDSRLILTNNGDTLPAGLAYSPNVDIAYKASPITSTTFHLIPQTYSAYATTVNTSTTVSITNGFTTNFIAVGENVSGTNIPGGATVASVVDATTITISAAATGSGSSLILTFSPTATSYMGVRDAGSGTHKIFCVESYPNEFNHNLYIQGYASINAISQFTISGNIFSRDATGSQFRASGTVDNNLFVSNAYNHNIAATKSGFTSVVSNNVYLDGVYYPYDAVGLAAAGPQILDDIGWHSCEYNFGSVQFNNNIIANSTDPSAGQRAITFTPGYNASASNNIVFNWGGNNNTDGTGTIQYSSGSIYTLGSVTGGSGYTDRSIVLTGAIADANGQAQITVASGANNLKDADGAGIDVIVYGLEGNGIDNRIWRVSVASDTQFSLLGSTFTGSFTSGTVYWPYYRVSLKKNGASDNTATASCNLFVKGGAVIATDLYSGHDGGIMGNSYAANDVLVIDATATTNNGFTNPGSGSGFSVPVSSVAAITLSGNKLDTAGTNITYSFPHPSPTAPGSVSLIGDYYYSIVGTSSWTDFLDAAVNNSKDSWNQNLTANSANIRIRTYFGISPNIGTTKRKKHIVVHQ